MPSCQALITELFMIVVLLTNKFNNLISKFGWFVTERYNWQGPLNKTTLFDFRFQWININVCIFICIRQPSHGARAARLHSRKGSYLSINNQLMWRSVDRAAVSRRYDSHGVMHSTQASHATSHIAAAQAMMANLHTALWHHCCRGTWHQTSHDQWPTLTGGLETAQWLGSSTPTAVNTSINMCGKTWDVQLNWRLFLQTNICICVSAHEVSPLMRGKVLRTLIDHQRPPAPAHGLGLVQQTSGRTTSQAVLQRNWNVGLHVILCYM